MRAVSESSDAILSVDGLKTQLATRAGVVRAVDGVSFALRPGETLGIVGESGCGKSMTALSIMRLVPQPMGRIVAGRIELAGRGDLLAMDDAAIRGVRGNEISMIFQEPMSSLNPVFRIGKQIGETIRLHQRTTRDAARARSIEMLRLVGIPSPETRVDAYPHELSGGMRQRVMIAMALACRPKVMIADEPTTALDVTIQAQILNLISRLKAEAGTAVILITHDLGVIARMAQRVCVMYAGVIVETAEIRDLFAAPLHPYTRGLLASIPRPDRRRAARRRLETIPGMVPRMLGGFTGCRFMDRCAQVHDLCRKLEPPLAAPPQVGAGPRAVRCWLHLPAPAA